MYVFSLSPLCADRLSNIKMNFRIHICRVDGWNRSGNISAETVFVSYTCLRTDIFVRKKTKKPQPTACDWAVEAALACWQENGGSLLSSSQHVCTSIGETLRLPLTISSSFFRLPLSLLHPPLPWYVTELTVKVEFMYIIRSGPFLLCFLIKISKSITVLLMKAQALTGRQDIRNSTFTMLQICSTFDGALTRPHAGPCSHLDVSICGKM